MTTPHTQSVPDVRETAILARMIEASGGPIATYWLECAAGMYGERRKVRRILGRMTERGLVTPRRSTGGLALWWKITDAGRSALSAARTGNPTGSTVATPLTKARKG